MLVTLSGPLLVLNALDVNGLDTTFDVTGLGPGSHSVALQVNPPAGLQVLGVSPSEVTVNVEAATPQPGSNAVTRLFGTDGIRGVANVDLTPRMAFDLGKATAARVASSAGGHVLIGQDTRRSGDMLVAAVAAGAMSMGADVHRLGVCPTPALVHLTAAGHFGAGIMVSASHNPARDNGLKVVDGQGLKLDDSVEDELEDMMLRADEMTGPDSVGIGRDLDSRGRLSEYLAHRLELAGRTSIDIRLVIDCAHGSGGVVAPQILAGTGATVDARFNEPDGMNINLDCGATAPEHVARIVAETGADIGFALDGDADRCVAIDEAATSSTAISSSASSRSTGSPAARWATAFLS